MRRLWIWFILMMMVGLFAPLHAEANPTPQTAPNRYYSRQGTLFAEQDGNTLTVSLPTAKDFAPLARDEVVGRLTDYYTAQGLSAEEALSQAQALSAAGGLSIYTSLELEFQAVAMAALNAQRSAVAGINEGGFVVIHPPSGEILAYRGSLEDNAPIDMATVPHPAEAMIYPLIYAAAMENGFSPASLLWDTEVEFKIGQVTFQPTNVDARFHGPVTLRTALANTYTVPAVKTLRDITPETLAVFAARLGINSLSSDPNDVSSVLLATSSYASLVDLVNAYMTFARGGYYIPTRTVVCVVDGAGNILYQHENRCVNGTANANTFQEMIIQQRRLVVDPRIAFFINDMLADNVARTPAYGANSPLITRDRQGGTLISSVMSSTGAADLWTIGYTFDLGVGVWLSYRETTALTALQSATPIWRDTMEGIYYDTNYELPPAAIPQPSGINLETVCQFTALRYPATDCPTALEWGLEPPVLVWSDEGQLTPAPLSTDPPIVGEDLPYIPVSPGVVQANVYPLTEAQAELLLSAQNDSALTVVPLSCRLDIGEEIEGAELRYFLLPPANATEANAVYAFAQRANLPVLPPYECSSAILSGEGGPQVAREVNPTEFEPWRTAAIYCLTDGSIQIFRIVNGQGELAFTVSRSRIMEVGIPATNVLLDESGNIRLYRLSSGNFQLNAPLGGDLNGYVKIWEGCP